MNDDEALKAFQTYFDLMSMNGGVRIYQAARKFGIFETIGKGISTVDEIALVCRIQKRPAQLLLDALCSLKVLDVRNGSYHLTPVMRFLAGNYQNLSDEYWDYLPELLRSGRPWVKMDGAGQSEKQYEAQVTALAWMMKPAAEAAAVLLEIGLKRKALHILDIGAGSAIWSLTFAAKDNAASVTAVDWPAVLEIAKSFAKRVNLSQRFTAQPGNYHEVEFSTEAFDLVVIGNVTHIESPQGNEALFTKAYKSLKPGGEIVIFDIFPGQEEGELSQSLYALGLALRTEQGHVYSRDELQELIVRSGFDGIQFHPLRVVPYTMGMLLAKKN